MATQKFWVRGLKEEEEGSVEAAVRALRGVLYVSVYHADECAEVEFDDDYLAPDDIAQALRKLGYEARLAG